MLRRTIIIHDHRCYADSLKSKELSPGGTVIWYADNVDPFVNDWDRSEKPRELRLVLAPHGGPLLGPDSGPERTVLDQAEPQI